MDHSLRDLLRRDRQLPGAVIAQPTLASISLAQSLAQHHDASRLTLRAVCELFSTPASSDGFARGCRTRFIERPGIKMLALTLPSWVAVDDSETRTLEGVLKRSKITHTDFPLRPWHVYYDWCMHVLPDPQYAYLRSRFIEDSGELAEAIECEWDTGGFPPWAWPQAGDRVWLRGRWIYDCGHPDRNSAHKTEIHPPKAIVSIRAGAARVPGAKSPQRTTQARVYLGRQGGYWDQDIGDEDYEFDVPLPPRPKWGAEPSWMRTDMTGSLPVAPVVVPFPPDRPTQLRVRVPLTDAVDDLAEYGFILECGWRAHPRMMSSVRASDEIEHLRVTIERIDMVGDGDTFGDDWHVYVCVNGQWTVWTDLSGTSASLSTHVDLDLDREDKVHVSACGFEADLIHDAMGKASGLTWADIADPAMSLIRQMDLEDRIFSQLLPTVGDENDPIGRIEVAHAATDRGPFVSRSNRRTDGGDDVLSYNLHYSIADRPS